MSNCIVFVATAWGSRYGGIDSFNHDLCIALAQERKSDLKIVCITSDVNNNSDKTAQEFDVLLIPLKEQNGDIEILKALLENKQLIPAWVIGHDVHTGPRANMLSECLNVPFAIFHHMDYASYKSYQTTNIESYINSQIEILEKAKIIFSIGPKLGKLAEDMVDDIPIREILPGLSLNLKTKSKLPHRFSAVTFGRLGEAIDRLKQTSLSVASFAHATNILGNPLGDDPEIVAVGCQENEVDGYMRELQLIVEENVGQSALVRVEGYKEEKNVLLDKLRKHTVCMVLSLHEGFGLVGLEAISVEVPIILSENTGLYLAIKNTVQDGIGCLNSLKILKPMKDSLYHEDNVKPVAEILIKIHSDKENAKKSASSLRQKLLDAGWTWSNAARNVIDGLELGLTQNSDSLATLELSGDKTSLETVISEYQKEINERKEEIDVIETQIAKNDPRNHQDIKEAIRWLSKPRDLALKYGQPALKKFKDLDQEMQENPIRLDDFYWELQQLVNRIRGSLISRNSISNKGYGILSEPPIPTSISHTKVHEYTLDLLKANIPQYVPEEVKIDLIERIDYLKTKLVPTD